MAISNSNIRVAVTMSKELKNKLQNRADEDKRTLSNYIVKILEDYLTESNKKNI